MLLQIGMDDTDSPTGGCTTHIAVMMVEKLLDIGVRFMDYPNLLRLNPNVPWKTRGNGAVCLRVELDEEKIPVVKNLVLDLVEEYAEFDCDNTNPGIVFHSGGVPEGMMEFSDRVVSQVVKLEEALRVVDEVGCEAVGFKNRRGLIGATAAVGGLQRGDYTYELLTYRTPENWGTLRRLDKASVWRMDEESTGTFNNVDNESKRVLIAPHGPDPVMYGVRGETPKSVYSAVREIVPLEPVERWAIFRSNQGTDAHLKKVSQIRDMKSMNPVITSGRVLDEPRTITGGHVIYKISDETGSVDCAAYEPTGSLRNTVRKLRVDDEITVYGGLREEKGRLTVNTEKLRVNTVVEGFKLVNPQCPECSGSMESMGRNKGYRCRHCGYRDGKLSKVKIHVERVLKPGLYMPPPGAQRHLAKPEVRLGREKAGKYSYRPLVDPWFGVGEV